MQWSIMNHDCQRVSVLQQSRHPTLTGKATDHASTWDKPPCRAAALMVSALRASATLSARSLRSTNTIVSGMRWPLVSACCISSYRSSTTSSILLVSVVFCRAWATLAVGVLTCPTCRALQGELQIKTASSHTVDGSLLASASQQSCLVSLQLGSVRTTHHTIAPFTSGSQATCRVCAPSVALGR